MEPHVALRRRIDSGVHVARGGQLVAQETALAKHSVTIASEDEDGKDGGAVTSTSVNERDRERLLVQRASAPPRRCE
jgi:hypothetical protein